MDFPALKQAVEEAGFDGWATIEQDCDSAGDTSPVDDARINLDYLHSIGLSD